MSDGSLVRRDAALLEKRVEELEERVQSFRKHTLNRSDDFGFRVVCLLNALFPEKGVMQNMTDVLKYLDTGDYETLVKLKKIGGEK